MLPLARAFDTARILFVTLLPTIALSFCFNALVGAAVDVPQANDAFGTGLPVVVFHVEEPAVADAAVTAAEVVVDSLDVEVDDVFDRAEQCCPGSALRMRAGPRWHWMIP